MLDPFEEEEFDIEDEWVEISDIDGRKASMRHLGTVRVDDRTYHVLGATREGEQAEKALMLIREDKTSDGANQYVIEGDEQEIERVVAHFVMYAIREHLQDEYETFDDEGFVESCGCTHMPGEFCYCDDPAYLQ